MSLTAIIFWAAYAGGICAAVVHPVIGVALYILVYHLHPESQWWGTSIEQAGIRTSMTVAAATIVGILLRRPRFEHGARQFPLPVLLILALGGYALLSLTWVEVNPTWTRGTFMAEKIVKLAIFVLILVRCVRKPEHYHLVVLSWLVGVAYVGYQAWGNVGTRVGGRLAMGLGGPDFSTASGLTVHLVASLPLLGAWFFMARSWWGRGFSLVAGALAVNTIIMMRTRNAVFGLAAMGLVTLFWLPRGYRAKGVAALVVAVALAFQLTDPGWWTRMRTIQTYQQDNSALNRLTYWRAAIDLARHHPQGIGLGQFHLRVQAYTPDAPSQHSAHNTYAACLAELGVPGTSLLILLALATFVRLRRVRRASHHYRSDVPVELWRFRSRFHLGWHAMALQTALVGYLASATFTTRLWSEDLWILLGLGACLHNVHLHLKAQAVPTSRARGRSPAEARTRRTLSPPVAVPPPHAAPPSPPSP